MSQGSRNATRSSLRTNALRVPVWNRGSRAELRARRTTVCVVLINPVLKGSASKRTLITKLARQASANTGDQGEAPITMRAGNHARLFALGNALKRSSVSALASSYQ
jgi:hypothetical protein